MMTTQQLAEVALWKHAADERSRHPDARAGFCGECGDPVPCPTVVIARAYRKLRGAAQAAATRLDQIAREIERPVPRDVGARLARSERDALRAALEDAVRVNAGPKRPEYEPITATDALGYLIEEAGEVLAAAGKTIRWGLDSVNPELPVAEQETNAAWLLREMADLEQAILRVRRICFREETS